MKINEFTMRQFVVMEKGIDISLITIKYKVKGFIRFKMIGLIR